MHSYSQNSLILCRGCGLASRIVNYHQDRFEAFAFFAIAYFPPTPGKFDLDAINDMSEKVLGYRHFGYWKFFEREDAAKIIEGHVSHHYSLLDAAFSVKTKLCDLEGVIRVTCIYQRPKSPSRQFLRGRTADQVVDGRHEGRDRTIYPHRGTNYPK